MTLVVSAPLAGRVVPVSDVPDPAFSGGMLGPGVAIEPEPTGVVDVVAPATGTVVALHPHAFAIRTEDGHGVLVHLGIDTVRLDGAGFTVHVEKGDMVGAGHRMVTWDPTAARAAGFATVCPVLLLEAEPGSTTAHATGHVAPGDALFRRD